jgi:phosphatidylserine decarboxylase
MQTKTHLKNRLEQVRQASRIHGGTVNMWAASVAVRLSRVPIPSRALRVHLYRTLYGKKYQALEEQELDRPLADYRSLNELFTRGVRPELRPLANTPDALLCPCDATLQEAGALDEGQLLTVKGIDYRLDQLVPGINLNRYQGGGYAVFFLSPADCHRVFAPAAGALHQLTHVPGLRLLVHPPFQRPEYPVFTLNERLILRLACRGHEYLMVMVAGWGVGHITHPFATGLRPHKRRIATANFDPPRSVAQGEWLATFELGSTVILLTPPGLPSCCCLDVGQKVRYGEPALTQGGEGAGTNR